MRRALTLVAVAFALPVAALGVAGLFGCAPPQDLKEDDIIPAETRSQPRRSEEVAEQTEAAAAEPARVAPQPRAEQRPRQQKDEYPVKISKDDFTKDEFWSVTSNLMKDDDRPSTSQALVVGAVLDKKDDTCLFRIYAILDKWMFISNIQIAIGDADPVRFESIAKDRNASSGSVGEALLFSCDAAKLIVSGGSQRVRLRASGDKGYMTVTLDPAWVASVGKLLAITPEQPPAAPDAGER